MPYRESEYHEVIPPNCSAEDRAVRVEERLRDDAPFLDWWEDQEEWLETVEIEEKDARGLPVMKRCRERATTSCLRCGAPLCDKHAHSEYNRCKRCEDKFGSGVFGWIVGFFLFGREKLFKATLLVGVILLTRQTWKVGVWLMGLSAGGFLLSYVVEGLDARWDDKIHVWRRERFLKKRARPR